MIAVPRLAAPVLAALALAASAAPALAATESFCDFTSVTGFSLNGSATHPGGSSAIRLTDTTSMQAGSAFFGTGIPFAANASFHAYFRFRISPNATGGDGLAFVLQSVGPAALGQNGGGLGYAGIGTSAAIELDTYQNSWDANANHAALLFDGDTHTHVAVATVPFPLTNGQVTYAWVDFDGPTKALAFYLSQTAAKPASPLFSATADLHAHLPSDIFVGFTAATGAATNRHEILEWELSTDGYPCCHATPGGACGAPVPLCSAGNLCVQCAADTDCQAPTPRCLAATSTCVACVSAPDCGGTTPVCDPSTNTCKGCSTNADCAPQPANQVCGPSGACVGCVDDTVCGGVTPVCDGTTEQCVAGCHVIGGVDSCGAGLMCDKQDGSIGTCGPVSTSSSSSGASSSSGGGAGGAMGTGGATTGSSSASSGGGGASGGSGGAASGSGGAASGSGGAASGREGIALSGGACWCGVGGGEADPRALAGVALIAAALAGRRQRRSRGERA